MSVKQNVSEFSDDAEELGGYVYTTSEKLSVKYSNDRTTRAIGEIFDYSGCRVLDLGCGDGFFTKTILDLGASEVIGLDPAAGAIAVARKRKLPRVTFEVGDLYKLKLEDYGEFDVVQLRGVLHHLPDAKKACQIAASLGCHVVGMEPNGNNPVLKVIEKTSRYHIEHEEQSYFPNLIDRWFAEAGARLEKSIYCNLVPIFSPDWMARGLRAIEPVIEATPLLRDVGCGQYVFNYRTKLGDE